MAANTWIDLVFSAQGGRYAKKLLPLGEPRMISGKLDRYGQALQMSHPEVCRCRRPPRPSRRASRSIGLTEGADQQADGGRSSRSRARPRARAARMDRAERAGARTAGRRGARRWRAAHAMRGDGRARPAGL